MSTIQNSTAFCQSRTCLHLQSALTAMEHACLCCTHAEKWCEEADLHVLAYAFRFTAAQEREHAAICKGLLRAHGGEPLPCSAPAEIPVLAPQELLARSARTAADKCQQQYPHYACVAREEGYHRIAAAFLRLAETECLHARRFTQYASALEADTLFRQEDRVSWRCLPCGHLHYGTEAPVHCSSCGCSRGHFIRSDFHPFAV